MIGPGQYSSMYNVYKSAAKVKFLCLKDTSFSFVRLFIVLHDCKRSQIIFTALWRLHNVGEIKPVTLPLTDSHSAPCNF